MRPGRTPISPDLTHHLAEQASISFATLPTAPALDLVIHLWHEEIVIGTHGRTLWVADLERVRANGR